MEDGTTYASPKHTGKAEERTHNGTSQKRAHGWTTWVGKYHYTRARMEDWELTEQKQYLLGGVLTVILQDLLEPITEVDSSQTKKQRIVKSFAFFTIFFLRSLL